jgi:hypothetical protein
MFAPLNNTTMKKIKTNEKALKSLIKSIEGTIYTSLLRERILQIMEMTMQDIKDNPKEWEGLWISPMLYEELNKIVQKELGFEN